MKRKGPPRFTEEVQQKQKEKQYKQFEVSVELHSGLDRLQIQEVVPGRATICMMNQFKMFPWAQDTMLMVGRLDEVVIKFLEIFLEIKETTIKLWIENRELH